jgi:hypothetical protein
MRRRRRRSHGSIESIGKTKKKKKKMMMRGGGGEPMKRYYYCVTFGGQGDNTRKLGLSKGFRMAMEEEETKRDEKRRDETYKPQGFVVVKLLLSSQEVFY